MIFKMPAWHLYVAPVLNEILFIGVISGRESLPLISTPKNAKGDSQFLANFSKTKKVDRIHHFSVALTQINLHKALENLCFLNAYIPKYSSNL